MSVFDSLIGQEAARRQLERAATHTGAAMSHAWLFTGPPGSGRSLAARQLAAALQCTSETPGCGVCHACRTVMDGNHPDVEYVATAGVTISVDETRELVTQSFIAPAEGPWRIIIVEDADRMSERTTNVLLKALEEPPTFTVWMLCTPSVDDVLPTIRSRCRHIGLVTPDAGEVATMLAEAEGVPYEKALIAARAAQSHVGRARGLLRDDNEWADRQTILREAVSVRGVGDAVHAAATIHAVVEAARKRRADGEGAEAGDDAAARAAFLAGLGIAEGERVPAALRGQVRAWDKEQERRRTRQARDGLDRAMVDMLSLYRDVLATQLGADVPLVNPDFADDIARLAAGSDVPQSLRRIDAISHARTRIAANVAPLLALEAMMVALRPQG